MEQISQDLYGGQQMQYNDNQPYQQVVYVLIECTYMNFARWVWVNESVYKY